ncbi:hydrolase [Streptomyces sp. CNQ-509]|uniref:HAD family hydrolase n=1 Tax=Streptomyces sp. CNQ-509 TaxID=444103 RepID=UPI00062DEC48|nr:HAD-IA family hydrolase [Streptomyces sp. CNQ-509]AKH85772.1 hydrolase [Streptomyces sp. CNQ-509]
MPAASGEPAFTHPARLGSRLDGLHAVVFDTDGVIIDSARIHAAAWQLAFDAALRARPPADPALRGPFDPVEDYRRHVDGKSRIDGAKDFLAARGLALPLGGPADPPGTGSVWGVAAAKERAFTACLAEHGVAAFPGSVHLLDRLRRAGLPCAAVSASRHARDLLLRAGVGDYFTCLVDGADSARLGLKGKPAPDLFLEAARRLGTEPRDAAVVEDALAGVEAGRAGDFALVVGVDRTGTGPSAADLKRRGAHLVIRDLTELLDP